MLIPSLVIFSRMTLLLLAVCPKAVTLQSAVKMYCLPVLLSQGAGAVSRACPLPRSQLDVRDDNMIPWYVKSLSDHDTHRGYLRRGRVQAVCGIEFTPVQAGLRSLELAGKPPDPDQICLKCQSARAGLESR